MRKRTIIIIIAVVAVITVAIIRAFLSNSNNSANDNTSNDVTSSTTLTTVTTYEPVEETEEVTTSAVVETSPTVAETTKVVEATDASDTNSGANVPIILRGQVTNSKEGYSILDTIDSNIGFYGTYEDAYNNPYFLENTGRYISIMLEGGNIDEISGEISFYNPEEEGFSDAEVIGTQLWESEGKYLVTYYIPDGPFGSFSSSSTNLIITFTVEVGSTNFYFAVSY